MRDDVKNNVRVIFDGEVEAPGAVNSGLPAVSGFVVFLGAEGWMVEVLKQEGHLLQEGSLNLGRSIGKGPRGKRGYTGSSSTGSTS